MTHHEQSLHIFTVISNRALLVDCNVVGFMAQGMHLRDTINTHFLGRTGGGKQATSRGRSVVRLITEGCIDNWRAGLRGAPL